MNNEDNVVTWRNKQTGELYQIYDRAIKITKACNLDVVVYHLKSSCLKTLVMEASEFYAQFEALPYKPTLDGYKWDDAQRAMLCQ